MKLRLLGGALLLVPIMSLAQSKVTGRDDCYVVGRIPAEKQVYVTSTIVVLDETVDFDATQRSHIRDQVASLMAAGNEIRIFSFSAYRDGRYTLPLMEARLTLSLDENARYTMRKDQVRDFDTCQHVALNNAKKQLEKVLEQYFERSTSALANSDILGTLKDVAEAVVPTLRSKTRRLVLISDMLENSKISSFYGPGGVPRTIDAAAELAKVEKEALFADFRGAAVYVIGAGVAPLTNKPSGTSYRSQTVMQPLKAFWSQYFERSNGRMIEFGQPLLLAPIGSKK